MAKAQFPSTFNWQTASPVTTFLPISSTAGNSIPSGTASGTMSGTNTIYTNILGLKETDNQGIEITYTGTPTGTIQVMVSNSGINFYALTFSPALQQPSGAASGYVISLTGIPFRYLFLQYTNTSGSGVITAYSQCKAQNS